VIASFVPSRPTVTMSARIFAGLAVPGISQHLFLQATGDCASLWNQCGGTQGGSSPWTGPTCCEGTCKCVEMNELFSRCEPTTDSNTCGAIPPTPPTPTPTPPPPTPPTPVPTPPSPMPTPSPSPTPSPDCTSVSDCSLNGECVDGVCQCDAGWRGDACAILDVLPADPTNVGYRNESMRTWSGNVIQEGGKWHMFVGAQAEPTTPAGDVGPYPSSDSLGCNAHVVRLEADAPEGPYRMKEVALPRMHFSPNVVRAPDGTVLLYTVADNNCPAVDQCCSGGSCYGCNFLQHMQLSLAWAPSVMGPWTEKVGILPGDAENPSATIMPDGKVILAYRMWFNNQEMITTATAESWQGPYVARGTPLWSASSATNAIEASEDPFLWHDHRGFHLLMHSMYWPQTTNWWVLLHSGAYAFSEDGEDWTFVNPKFVAEDETGVDGPFTPSEPWSGTVQWTNGSSTLMTVRQKPSLIFDSDGRATHLVNGVDFESTPQQTTGCYWRKAWTLIQPLAKSKQ